MQYREWQPVYNAIIADFGYDQQADAHARDELAAVLADEHPLSLSSLTFPGTVAVCGAAPSLAGDLSRVRTADHVIAASTAVDVLRDAGIAVDCMVTDLDKNPGTARDLSHAGTPVAVHAHGDNVRALHDIVPTLTAASILPTTQVAPRDPVGNPGGFTDGDRAAFLADHGGADHLVFAGWLFDDPTVSAEKAKKLMWAERLLYWLELRREDHFSILDGRRDRITLPWR